MRLPKILLSILTLSLIGSGASAEKKIVGSIPTAGLAKADYAKSARITAAQAQKIATDSVSGTVSSLALENEDGYLVYAVEINRPYRGMHEILVDAGNGAILTVQKQNPTQASGDDDDDEEGDDND